MRYSCPRMAIAVAHGTLARTSSPGSFACGGCACWRVSAQIGSDIELYMHLFAWHPLLAQLRVGQRHREASCLAEVCGAYGAPANGQRRSNRRRGLHGKSPGFLLLWESSGITGHMHCGSRMTRNSLVILMPRNAIGFKRQDDVWLEAPDLLDQTLYDLPGWRLDKGARMILRQCSSQPRITIAQHMTGSCRPSTVHERRSSSCRTCPKVSRVATLVDEYRLPHHT